MFNLAFKRHRYSYHYGMYVKSRLLQSLGHNNCFEYARGTQPSDVRLIPKEKIMSGYSKGTKVKWDWSGGTGEGTIKTVYTRKTTRKIKGTDVTRKASEECPAYFIEQDDGDTVLKSHSEVTKA